MKLIVGRKPVFDAINAGEKLESVFILFGQQGPIIDAIRVACTKREIKCTQIKLEKYQSLVKDVNAQGVVALGSEAAYFSLKDIINRAKANPKNKFPSLLIIDSIQDTHNLGAILRTAECAGVDGIVLTKFNSAPINETVMKTSAGAVNHLKVCLVGNVVQAIQELKENGFWIIGSTLTNAKFYDEIDYSFPSALIVGNEEKGMRKLVADQCDFLVKIPMKGKVQSLNVSVATGVLLFSILKSNAK
ncbi:MAG: 23S rRNA (guanosine(2251)-2'-O)-methyltransferase RlmB [Ignavibacteria bacterium CG22_combo_CG10-13_8_21_14_all_37_15]|nr:MAG: 23S rRNA (guanosine(2251)-2'-O)-methyltransferase RlmB [Ignavibacteria bacterium CG22_combo_CG10-13_8_21_14_all_37_15]